MQKEYCFQLPSPRYFTLKFSYLFIIAVVNKQFLEVLHQFSYSVNVFLFHEDMYKKLLFSLLLCVLYYLVRAECFIEHLEDFQCYKKKCLCKNLTLKIKATESVQYFEISQLLKNKHKNSNFIK